MINPQHISTHLVAPIELLISLSLTLQATWVTYRRSITILATVTIFPQYLKLLNLSMTATALSVGKQIKPTT